MKYLIGFIFLLETISAIGQANYNYNNIPDSLKKNANYVVWEDLMEFDIIDKGSAKEKVKFAVCIIDQYSKKYNQVTVGFNKNESVNGFKVEIYDKNGNFVKKAKSSDIKDVSAVAGYSLFDDSRMLTTELLYNQYPYTLVYEFEKKVDGLLSFPPWSFQPDAKTGVLFSELTVKAPKGYKFKYKEFNLKETAQISTTDKYSIYKWTEKNLKPFDPIELTPNETEYLKSIEMAPINFSEGGYEGNLDSWENYGIWVLKLNEGRDNLPEATKKALLELIKNAKNDKEKVKILYQFMQNKTRYVSVQLGIGGFQTFPAEYVETKGYGDCKALSNYMRSLLKVIGIKSYQVDINAGKNENDILYNFPSQQFNHVILCVPFQNDTLWLECTSQQQPFNFLGSFTEDRHALLIADDGGKLVKTPKYGKEINTTCRKALIKIDLEGNATGSVNTIFKGLSYEDRELILNEPVKEQKDFLKEAYPLAGLEINSFKFDVAKDEIPSIIEKLDIVVNRLASLSNKRMFLKSDLFNESGFVPKNEERKISFRLNNTFTDVDTIQFQIPDGYTIESKPQDTNLQNKFGGYSVKTIQNGSSITYIRNYYKEKGTFPASDYKAFYEFRKQIVKSDKTKLVLVKKE